MATSYTIFRLYVVNVDVIVAPVEVQPHLAALVNGRWFSLRPLFGGHRTINDYVLLCTPFAHHVFLCTPLAHLLEKHAPKALVEENVDDKVDSRVEYDEHVSDWQHVELVIATILRRVRCHDPQDSGEEGRQLTHDQHDDNDYKNVCHRVFVMTAHCLRSRLHTAMCLQRFYEANVQQCEDAYWQNNYKYSIQYVVVY